VPPPILGSGEAAEQKTDAVRSGREFRSARRVHETWI